MKYRAQTASFTDSKIMSAGVYLNGSLVNQHLKRAVWMNLKVKIINDFL